MSRTSTLELRTEAGRLVTEARSVLEKADEEKRALTSEEETRFDALHADAEQKIAQAQRHERQGLADAGFTEPAEGPQAERNIDSTQKGKAETRVSGPTATPEYAEAFVNFLRTGRARGLIERESAGTEQRATLQADLDTGGGFFAASERFISRILKSVDDSLIVRQLATVYPVGRNETLGAPRLDGDITAFAFGAGELTEAAEDTGIAFGLRELRPRDLKRKLIKVSKALLRSSRIDIEGVIADRVAYALAAGLETAYMTGGGASEPLGLFTASDNGIGTARDVVTGNATGFTADGLITIQGTLADIYQGPARWLFHRDAITAIRKLKDGMGQYLWQPGLQAGTPSVILGKPYVTGDKVPKTYTNGLYAGMYGDFSFYWIVDAVSGTVQRLMETYALTGQIGLLFDDMAADAAPVLAEAFVRIKVAA